MSNRMSIDRDQIDEMLDFLLLKWSSRLRSARAHEGDGLSRSLKSKESDNIYETKSAKEPFLYSQNT